MVSSLLVAFSAAALLATASAAKCESPKVALKGSHSTSDAFFHFQTAVVVEFGVTCSNSPKDLQLYAVNNRKIYSVASGESTNNYQVSILLEHSDAYSQTVDISIFDEEGIAAYKKDNSATPLGKVEHYHAGLSRKWPITSEAVAVLISFVAVYYAFTFKSALN
uniref:Translocon-associated protein subunit delta n=1 Tax=Pristionchus pacificus TaxID=54126 RepID=A0A8R1YN67_PRIPA